MLLKEELYWSHFNVKFSKSVFGKGPWDFEPDRIWYLDDETGFYCLILRHTVFGNLCGYIGIPPAHPWFGKYYDELNFVIVHGGLTYSESNGKYIEAYYEDGHKFAAPFIETHSELNGKILLDFDYWVIGFDTAHFGDLMPGFKSPGRVVKPYRDVAFMEAELKQLCKQALAALE